MRILHTESMGVSGGQPRRVIDELKIIQEAGHKAWLACRPDTWLESEARREGIETISMPLVHTVDPKSLMLLLRTIRSKKIDIVHSHNSKDSYSAAVACKLSGTKFVRSKHSDFTKKPGPIYRFADRIITTGEKIRRELTRYGFPEDRIVSIPSYPDEKRFIPDPERRKEQRKKWELENRIVVGSMAGLAGNKRSHFFFEAIETMRERYPALLYLVAGKDKEPKYRESFYRALEEKKLQTHVRFIGLVDPMEFLDAIDIYVCPSRREGVPQTVMQAMMMGKPVIASRIGGIPDLNIEENLLLADKERREEFTEALKKLLENPELRERLGAANRRLSLERFNRTVLAEKLMKLYRELLEP